MLMFSKLKGCEQMVSEDMQYSPYSESNEERFIGYDVVDWSSSAMWG